MGTIALLSLLLLANFVVREILPAFVARLLDPAGRCPPPIPARHGFGRWEWEQINEFGYLLSPDQIRALREYREAFPRGT